MTNQRAGLLAPIIGLALIASACGGSSGGADGDTTLRGAGDISVDLDQLATPEETLDDGGSAGAAEGEGETTDSGTADPESESTETTTTTTTVPQNQSEGGQVNALMDALTIFNDCLSDKGTEFLGLPGGAGGGGDADPTSPVNDPGYIEDLVDCAAVSQIQQAFQGLQEANDAITDPVEIEETNRALVRWGECMEGRGWIVELVANPLGLLTPNPTPPEGETFLSTDDLQECTAAVQDESEDDS